MSDDGMCPNCSDIKWHSGPCRPPSEQQTEKQSDVEVNGTFSCPICGSDTPHEHSGVFISQYRSGQSLTKLEQDLKHQREETEKAVQRVATLEGRMDNRFVPVSFEFSPSNDPRSFGSQTITIETRDGFDGRKWCIKQRGNVFTRERMWEWEMQPSSRDDGFLERARYSSAEEAANWLVENLTLAAPERNEEQP